MPKAGKTHKGMAKRIKVTKNNKLMQSKGWKRHLLTNKGRSTKRNKLGKEVSSSFSKTIKRLIPAKLR